MCPTPLESLLDPDTRKFFLDSLGGKCVNITPQEDVTGEYTQWFENELGKDHAVLIRPDFYNFGHVEVSNINLLVRDLQSKMTSV